MSQAPLVDETKELEDFKRKHPHVGRHFKDLRTSALVYRPLRNTAGAHYDLSDNKTIECHVSEIMPGSHNKKHRHMNEAIIYILAGRGHSEIHDDEGHFTRVDWSEGDVFSPPLNWWHQHFNDDPAQPARYLAFTNIGLMTRLGLFSKESAKDAA